MSKRLLLIPRWAGTPESDWYPWLAAKLEADRRRPFDPVVVADMPHPELPLISAWVPRVKQLIGTDRDLDSRTIVMAHSVGCQAALRALAEMESAVAGVFLVAPWFAVDAPWDAIRPWIDTPFDVRAARERAGRVVAVMSDNDRHRMNWQANKRAWEEQLGAQVIMIPGANHFNGSHYPALLQALLDLFGEETEAEAAGQGKASR